MEPTASEGGREGPGRLDQVLVAQGFFSSRQQAQQAILAGLVRLNGQKALRPGQRVPPGAEIQLEGQEHPYVSRGGLKLRRALDVWSFLPVQGAVAMDVGASTGGFTDCLLQAGARQVWAVDVGYGQLAWKLRQDPRVVVRERTNIRHFSEEGLPPFDLITVDASFISVELFLERLLHFLRPGGYLVVLVKPQFEAGRAQVGKKGVVKDPAVHARVLEKVTLSALASGARFCGVTYSPVKGPAGNIEFLLCLQRPAEAGGPGPVQASPYAPEITQAIQAAVAEAHQVLDGSGPQNGRRR
ncbi:MAG: TlyA family RNA methyltransferase [Firmicutes bacterium]|nr:TlyA family RNA methyltransferase [Bacillota bacterium]